MGRKLVTIRQIMDLRPVATTPRLQIAVVDGWTCAVRTGLFSKGELVVFFEIDSFLPAPAVDPRYQAQHNPLHTSVTTWQGVKGIHVKSIMVGSNSHEISQGVVLKLCEFPELESIYVDYTTVLGSEAGREIAIDTCFAEKLGVKKWQPAATDATTTTSLGPPPVFFPKTDIERVQNIKTLFAKKKYAQAVFQESVKMDGSAMTVYFVRRDSQFHKSVPRLPDDARRADMPNGRVGVCSRHHDLSAAGTVRTNPFWWMALCYGLPWKLNLLNRNLAVRGELVGSSVGGNRHGYAAGRHDFYAYGIYDVDAQRYLRPAEAALRAGQLGLKHVPVLGYVRLRDVAASHEELLARAEGVGMNGERREGLVYKNVEDGRWFKVRANDYLLKHGE
ncbi:type II membrane protein [Hypoxylon texense]